ncbi:putative glutamate receptor [Arctopsyche grandis]|uniref:putative glutamate receptor n=1 Tax=Arctopsyche grandis TaxID=121162 RepID=UPI00406D8CCE
MTDSFNMTAPGADIERIFMEEVHALSRWSVMIVGNEKRTDTSTRKDDNGMSYVFADKADYYVIIVDSLPMFQRKISNLVELDSWNPHANMVVLCSARFSDEASMRLYSQEILEYLWSYYILYAVILLQDVKVKTTFRVFSWNPYDPPKRCGVRSENVSETIVIYDTCSGGHLSLGVNLFGNKLPSNMQGCTLKVLAMIMPPFVNELADGSPGIELELLKTISLKLNVRLALDFNSSSRGDKLNDHWTGMIGRLEKGEADLALGGIYPDNIVHEDFDASTSYLQDSYTWVVPRALLLPRWLALIIIFERNLWLSAGALYVLCTLIWLILGKLSGEARMHKCLDHCALNTWVMNIGGVAYNRPLNQTLRIFFIFLCIYNIVLVTAYQTKLIMVLTQPSYENQMDSLKDILESDLNVGGLEELKDLFDNADEELYKIVSKRYKNIPNVEETLHDVIVHRNFSLIASRMFLDDISSKKIEFTDSYGDPNYHTLSSNVLSIPVEIVGRKGFPFIGTISDLISLTKSNGLMSKWLRDYAVESKRKSAEVKRSATFDTRVQDENDDVSLSLEHLEGGFCILAVGYLAGTIAFILEIHCQSSDTIYIGTFIESNAKSYNKAGKCSAIVNGN